MTRRWRPQTEPTFVRRIRLMERAADENRLAAQGKVPAWTSEDEANLRRRVQRLAAKEMPDAR